MNYAYDPELPWGYHLLTVHGSAINGEPLVQDEQGQA